MDTKSPLQAFLEEAPAVQQAYSGFIQSLITAEGMDQKTKQLIYLGMKIVADDELAVKAHVSMAKHAGATRDEIKITALLGISTIGMKAASKYLPRVLEYYDQ